MAIRRLSSVAASVTSASSDAVTLAGSVKPYRRHVVFLEHRPHSDWPAKLEAETGTPFARFHAALSTVSSTSGKPRVFATAVDVSGPEHGDLQRLRELGGVLVFPEAVSVSAGAEGSLFDALLGSTISNLPGVSTAKLPGLWMLVCAHSKRDFRCEQCGPKLACMLQQVSSEVPVRVLKSSHIGGHRWAGNVIVYPAGDWFGLVNSQVQAGRIVEHYSRRLLGGDDTLPADLQELWRGDASTAQSDAKAKFAARA